MNYAGIDLSLTSPAICVNRGDTFDVEHCKMYFMTDIAKRSALHFKLAGDGTVTAYEMQSYTSQEERVHNISVYLMKVIEEHNVGHVFIEDYAFSATGQVFQIAENAGLLKHKLWMRRIGFTLIPPTVVKKYATGKGNAKKEGMDAAFREQTGLELKGPLLMTEKQWNPSSDLIDAYFICKCGMEQLNGIGTSV